MADIPRQGLEPCWAAWPAHHPGHPEVLATTAMMQSLPPSVQMASAIDSFFSLKRGPTGIMHGYIDLTVVHTWAL